MKISHIGGKITVEDKYIEYSPYLSTLNNTNLNKNIDDDGYIPVLDWDLTDYIMFLKNGNINNFNSQLYDFMGHENVHGYSDEYFKIRLEDRWIRDNMYKYGLIEEQLYGLIELDKKHPDYDVIIQKINSHLGTLIKHCKPVIAGGIALYFANGTNTYGDIDLFFVGEECDKVTQFITKKRKKFIFTQQCATHCSRGYQVIFRRYKSISEIVHGFDIDCCGFLLYNDKLYCTKRALYSLNNKTNWFDPDRMSPSYIYRLSKYARRGYKILLPGVTEKNFNYNLFYQNLFKFDIYPKSGEHPNIRPEQYIKYYRFCLMRNINPTVNNISLLCLLENGEMQNIYSRYHRLLDDNNTVDILLIMKYMNLYPNIKRVSDYSSKLKKFIKGIPNWIEQEPMSQITSTFNPEPIQDIQEYYNKSKYYIDNSIENTK